LQDEDTKIYSHLPTAYQVTNAIEQATEWFEQAVKVLTSRYGNRLISVEDRELDYMCTIKQAVFECGEPAYKKGRYMIELKCYTHNPII
jgi:hypothetical protein